MDQDDVGMQLDYQDRQFWVGTHEEEGTPLALEVFEENLPLLLRRCLMVASLLHVEIPHFLGILVHPDIEMQENLIKWNKPDVSHMIHNQT